MKKKIYGNNKELFFFISDIYVFLVQKLLRQMKDKNRGTPSLSVIPVSPLFKTICDFGK